MYDKEIVFFIVLYLLPGIITTVLLFFLNSKKSIQLSEETVSSVQWAKIVTFMTMCFYFVSVGIKTVTGNGFNTYPKTIAIMGISTIKHYMVINLFLMVIILCGIIFVFKSKTIRVAERILSTIVGILLPLALFHGRGPLNIEFTIVFLIGSFIGIVSELLLKQKLTPSYPNKKIIKQILTIWIPVEVFSLALHYFFVPMELYLTNIEEFRIRGVQLVLISLIPIAVLLIINTLLILLMTTKMFKLSTLSVFAISLMKYVQEVALNGQMQSMQGFSQKWDNNIVLINNGIWIASVAAIIIIGIAVGNSLRWFSYLCSYLTLMFIATIAVISIKTGKPTQIGLTAKGSLDVNPNKNTIVFVLDKCDAQFFERIMENDSDFIEPLLDFTYYPDITSPWLYTDRSIPFLLSDVEGIVGVTPTESRQYCYENSTLLDDYHDAGYSIGVYSEGQYLTPQKAELCINYDSSPSLEIDINGCIDTMLRMAQYSCMPFSLKHRYSYSDVDCLIMADFTGVWNCNDDSVYYRMLKNEGLRIVDDGSKGAFRFIHGHGAHEPYIMNEECESVSYSEEERVSRYAADSQIRGAFKVVTDYLEQLKGLGLYDSSTILIIADHGQSYTMDRFMDYVEPLEVKATSRPLCLCKMPNDHNNGNLLITNEGRCTQAEIVETMRESITGEKKKNRNRLDEISIDDYPERKMTRIQQTIGESSQYIITGDARIEENWHEYETDFDVVAEE